MVGVYKRICEYNILSPSSSKHYNLCYIVGRQGFAATANSFSPVDDSATSNLRIDCISFCLVAVESYYREFLQMSVDFHVTQADCPTVST